MVNSAAAPFKCEYTIPEPTRLAKDVLSRWSDSRLTTPAVIVKPETEDDVIDAIQYAKQHNLTLIPAGGGHGSYVPIGSQTLYLDMRNFNKVSLDKSAGHVEVGGGALVGEVVKALDAEGYYALFPNSNSLGMVGSVLGGGSVSLTKPKANRSFLESTKHGES